VVEILPSSVDAGRGGRGSGYLLDDRLVLTAGHVVGGVDEMFGVRALGRSGWVDARAVWRGEDCDLGLLELVTPEPGSEVRVALGRIAGAAAIDCVAVGFPDAQAREQSDVIVYEPEQLAAKIAPLTLAKSGLLALGVYSGVPRDIAVGSAWQGASGAGVFCGDLLVGVLRTDPASFGADRLVATPITSAVTQPGFVELLTGRTGQPLSVRVLEAQGLLEAPYEGLARGPSVPASLLLHPRHGVVAFRGREQEVQVLRQWCAGDRGLGVALLTGSRGDWEDTVGARAVSTPGH
jgi:hypothetical protein